MINFKYIRNFFNKDERFKYTYNLLRNEMQVGIENGQSFLIRQEKYNLFTATYILINNISCIKVNFIISNEESFRNSINAIYKLATVYDKQHEETKTYEEDKMAEINHILSEYKSIINFDNQPKEAKPSVSEDDIELALDTYDYVVEKYLSVEGDAAFNAAYGPDVNIFISRDKDKWLFQCKYLDETKSYREDDIEEINELLLDYASLSDYNNYKETKDDIKYPTEGNTMVKQTINKSFDFLNDYKVVKLAEKAINDNFAELANDFIKYSNSEKDTGTILSCGNSKVLFSATKFNRKITIEFGRDGKEPFRYVYTNKGINLLNDYDPKALITIGNLIESAVDAWLENDNNRMNIEDLNERIVSTVDNIKTMIGLINSTIGKYNV